MIEDHKARAVPSFSPDGRRLATGQADGTIVLYDLPTGSVAATWRTMLPVTRMAFSPDSKQLALATEKAPLLVQVRSVETGEDLYQLAQAAPVHHLAWHPSRPLLAVACDDSSIYLWDTVTASRKQVLSGDRNQGIMVAFNHAGDLLASLGWEGTLRLWDPDSGRQLFSTRAQFYQLQFSPDDRYLAAEMRGNRLAILAVAQGREYQALAGPSAGGSFGEADIGLEGRVLAAGMEDGVRLWDLHSRQELALIPGGGGPTPLWQASDRLLVGSWPALNLWPIQADFTKGQVLFGPAEKLPLRGGMPIAQSADGKRVAVSRFTSAYVADLAEPRQPVSLGPHDDLRFITMSPDGQWVATGSHGNDPVAVKVWEAGTGRLVKQIAGNRICRVQFSPNGRWLATGGSQCQLWTVGVWTEGPRVPGIERTQFAFSADSRLLAVETGEGLIHLVEPASGRQYASFECPNQDRARWLGFTPDGGKLVMLSNESLTAHMWDLRLIGARLAEMGLPWDLTPTR